MSSGSKRLQAAYTLKRASWVGFWVQVVLGVVASLILLFALLQRRARLQSGLGLFLGLLGIATLALGIWLKYRSVELARRLADAEWEERPRKNEVFNRLFMEMGVSLMGMLATLLGTFVVVGSLFAKALLVPQGTIALATQPVDAMDILVVQGLLNTIAAHFGALLTSLWPLWRITRTEAS
ncbi:MAG: DUF3611 family protein [Gloeomargarita sp. SKYG116]|nr:DUF3611 family protein [Gloeomargarita sp. SKYG116]MDW8400929.1 DUF3611 family protein [Gloeomargarita sp. SKYGB_i_bin116]